MDRTELFLGTVDDLGHWIAAESPEYRLLMSTILLRKLLLDPGRNLTDQVRQVGDVEQYHVANSWRLVSKERNGMWSDVMLSGSVARLTLEEARRQAGEPMLPGDFTRYVDRSTFLEHPAATIDGEVFSVADVIYYAAYVAGGVHAGVAGSEDQKRLELLVKETERRDMGYLGATLRGIGFTTWEAMQPIAMRLRAG